MKNNKNAENLLITIYSYVVNAFLGWNILSFINIYFQLNQNRIQFSFQQWMAVQYNYFPIAGIVIVLLFIILISKNSIRQKQFTINYLAFKFHAIYLVLFIVGALINYILCIYQSHQNILELINFIIAIMCLSQLSKVFYIKEITAWYHPTTLSTFYISAALLGFSQLVIFKIISTPFSGYVYFLLLLMVIEVFRIFTRFKYLSKFSYETNMIARSLLGKYGIYFGVRVIAGIFMPFVYIIYAIFANDKLFQGVGMLLLIGEFIERLLFIYLSDTPTKAII